tara:strand:- start:20258 stop:21271 length:1014 start_codon:yes stop_codon:yes gene_type:complete
MAQGIHSILNALLLAAISSSILMWVYFLLNRNRSSKLKFDPRVELVARNRPFWSPADFLVMFGTFVLTSSLIGAWFISEGWLPSPSATIKTQTLPTETLPAQARPIEVSPTESIATSPDQVADVNALYAQVGLGVLSGTIALLVALTFALLTHRDRKSALSELGFVGSRETVRQGLWASLWLLPPVLLISLLVSWMIPYEHPVLDTMKAMAANPSITGFAALFIATALVTPLVEEFMFRVLLQGGLQGMIDRGGFNDEDIQDDTNWRATSWIPILVTSVLFAMMHLGQGGAPIPLLFLSIGLGYLYRQTGSIVPPLIVHCILNASTMLVEFSRLLAT